jgi:hypothetical protein
MRSTFLILHSHRVSGRTLCVNDCLMVSTQ